MHGRLGSECDGQEGDVTMLRMSPLMPRVMAVEIGKQLLQHRAEHGVPFSGMWRTITGTPAARSEPVLLAKHLNHVFETLPICPITRRRLKAIPLYGAMSAKEQASTINRVRNAIDADYLVVEDVGVEGLNISSFVQVVNLRTVSDNYDVQEDYKQLVGRALRVWNLDAMSARDELRVAAFAHTKKCSQCRATESAAFNLAELKGRCAPEGDLSDGNAQLCKTCAPRYRTKLNTYWQALLTLGGEIEAIPNPKTLKPRQVCFIHGSQVNSEFNGCETETFKQWLRDEGAEQFASAATRNFVRQSSEVEAELERIGAEMTVYNDQRELDIAMKIEKQKKQKLAESRRDAAEKLEAERQARAEEEAARRRSVASSDASSTESSDESSDESSGEEEEEEEEEEGGGGEDDDAMSVDSEARAPPVAPRLRRSERRREMVARAAEEAAEQRRAEKRKRDEEAVRRETEELEAREAAEEKREAEAAKAEAQRVELQERLAIAEAERRLKSLRREQATRTQDAMEEEAEREQERARRRNELRERAAAQLAAQEQRDAMLGAFRGSAIALQRFSTALFGELTVRFELQEPVPEGAKLYLVHTSHRTDYRINHSQYEIDGDTKSNWRVTYQLSPPVDCDEAGKRGGCAREFDYDWLAAQPLFEKRFCRFAIVATDDEREWKCSEQLCSDDIAYLSDRFSLSDSALRPVTTERDTHREDEGEEEEEEEKEEEESAPPAPTEGTRVPAQALQAEAPAPAPEPAPAPAVEPTPEPYQIATRTLWQSSTPQPKSSAVLTLDSMFGTSTEPEFLDVFLVPLLFHIADVEPELCNKNDHARQLCRVWAHKQLLGAEYLRVVTLYLKLLQGPETEEARRLRLALLYVKQNPSKYSHVAKTQAAGARQRPALWPTAKSVLYTYQEGWKAAMACVDRLTAARQQRSSATTTTSRAVDEVEVVVENSRLTLVSRRVQEFEPSNRSVPNTRKVPQTREDIERAYTHYIDAITESDIDDTAKAGEWTDLKGRVSRVVRAVLAHRVHKQQEWPPTLHDLFEFENREIDVALKHANIDPKTQSDNRRAYERAANTIMEKIRECGY